MIAIMLLSFSSESDRQKFEYVYDKYKNLLLHKAYGILRDRMLAEDAVSEAFLRTYKNIDKIEEPDSNRTVAFLVTIVKNVALTMLKKRKSQSAEPLEEWDAALQSGPTLEDVVASALSADAIYAMVDQLEEEYRSVFLLKYAYDLPHREIGRLLHISENNVTVRLHRVKKKLAAMLLKGGYTDEAAR